MILIALLFFADMPLANNTRHADTRFDAGLPLFRSSSQQQNADILILLIIADAITPRCFSLFSPLFMS